MEHCTFIVPVHGASGLYLPRCLASLLDNQDYPHKDVVVVFDGDDQMKTALKCEKLYKEDDRVKFIHQDQAGAPSARNRGLDEASGKYVWFFDCDSILKAGGLTTFMEAFEENPDCDFVYAGYRFFMHDGYSDVCPTHALDPYLLTCNNYISTMNPIKKEKCPRWDESLKTLQDWDFWLTVVCDNKVKGKMLSDIYVVTEAPSEHSLSGKSHRDWEASVNAVREKHGIKDRNTCFFSYGAEFQSIRRAKFMNADFQSPIQLLSKEYDYDAVVSMGYYVDSVIHPYAPFAKCNGAQKIVHFIGTDVWQLQRKKFYEVEFFAKNFPGQVSHIFANAPWLVDELKRMGIESELLYCPIDPSPYKIKDFPEKFTLAVYRSDSNPMHNEVFMTDVARSCPDIQFKFFGGTKPNVVGIPKNIELMGTIPESEMPDFIASTSGIVRITQHDGFPASLAEWAMSCRPTICNLKDFPMTYFVDAQLKEDNYMKCKEDVIKTIRRVKRISKQITTKDLIPVRDHFIELLDPEVYIKRMEKACAG